jgi:hypothetical protein
MSRRDRIVGRLAVGSRAVYDRRRKALGEWAQAPERAWECWFRIAILLGLGYLLWRLLEAHHALMWLLIGGWGIAAWRAGVRPKSPPAAAEPERDPEAARQVTPEGAVDALQRLGDGGHSVLLTALRDFLRVRDTKRVRELLAQAGVPVTEGVRTRAGNGPGVYRGHVPPPSPTPSDAPSEDPGGAVGAGESANANANNVRVRQYESGAVAEFTEDPDNPHRTHIRWAKTP